MNDRIVELQDTKFTIEVEAIRWPEDEVASRTRIFEASGAEGKLFPYSIRTRVKVGDRQIGLVNGVQFAARMDCDVPFVAVDFNAPPGMSDRLQESLDIYLQQIGQFPFIQSFVQGEARHQFQPKMMTSSSVEELATQLKANIQGDKDWHDRAVDAVEAKVPESQRLPAAAKSG